MNKRTQVLLARSSGRLGPRVTRRERAALAIGGTLSAGAVRGSEPRAYTSGT